MEAATPLVTNKDFRQLLQTPRGTGATPGYSNIPQKSSEQKKQTKSKDEKKKEKEEQAYRDRARERREGRNIDYARDELLLETLVASKGASQYISKDDTLQLGGDVDSTHLVKGLDFNLLRKQKERLDGKETNEEKEPVQEEEQIVEDIDIKTPFAKSVHDYLIVQKKRSNLKNLFEPGRMAYVYEENEEGDVDSIPVTLYRSTQDVPKPADTLFADLDQNVLENLAKIISYLTVGPHHGKKGKKKERLELLQQIWDTNKTSQAPLGFQQLKQKGQTNDKEGENGKDRQGKKEKRGQDRVFDDIEDEEAADYKKNVAKNKQSNIQSDKSQVNIFDDSNQDEDFNFFSQNLQQQGGEPVEQQPGLSKKQQREKNIQQQKKQQQSNLPPTAEEKFSSLRAQAAHDAAQQRPGDNNQNVAMGKNSMKNLLSQDAYEECFPDQLGGAWEYDSDDNKDDYTQMDSKAKGQSRYDFTTDEDWQRSKEQKEAMPKAAYQFGLKMADGRKQQKSLDGTQRTYVMRKEQKFNKDMRQLESFMNQKFEKDYGQAFQAPESEDQVPSKRKKLLNV